MPPLRLHRIIPGKSCEVQAEEDHSKCEYIYFFSFEGAFVEFGRYVEGSAADVGLEGVGEVSESEIT